MPEARAVELPDDGAAPSSQIQAGRALRLKIKSLIAVNRFYTVCASGMAVILSLALRFASA
jgi:hypothetical protein